ncbi:MAG: hypothetical protein V3T77_08345, partial [Planctomycetota bacterium]
MVQSPRTSFSDPELQGGRPALNALGLPQPVTGGFASVYEINTGQKRWAVRCFLSNIPDIQKRYALISKYLKKHSMKYMVEFEYLPEGIRVRGNWHPTVKMEWVDGDTLTAFIQQNLKKPKLLKKMASRWLELLKALEAAQISHCDLQHGNILVCKENFRLIDYDGMYVPALKGWGSHEKGHPAFQHPQREGKDYNGTIDRFSSMVIYVSMVALAHSPDLWDRFCGEDNLCFQRPDFMSPDKAAIFQTLNSLGNAEISQVSEVIRMCCKSPIKDVPRLQDVLEGKVSAPIKGSRKATPVAGSAPAGQPKRSGRPVSRKASRSLSRPAKSRPAIILPGKGSPPAKAPAASAPAAGGGSGWLGGGATATKTPPAKPAPPPAKPKPPPPPPPKAKAPPPAPRAPAPSRAPRAPAPASVKTAAPLPPPPKSHPVTVGSAPAQPGASGWMVEWVRPGWMKVTHIQKLPIYGKRDAPRRFLGIPLGTKKEKYVESCEDRTDERMTAIGGHRASITSLAFSSNGRLLASSSLDRTIRVWKVASGREDCPRLEAKARVVKIAFVPDRSVIAAALHDCRILLWDFGLHRQVIHTWMPDRSRPMGIAVSKDGSAVVAGGSKGSFAVWQTATGELDVSAGGMKGRVTAVAFTPDGSGVVCGTRKGWLYLYDRRGGRLSWGVKARMGRIRSLAVTPSGSNLVMVSRRGLVTLWDMRDGSMTRRIKTVKGVRSAAISHDGRYLLIGLRSGTGRILESETEKEVAALADTPRRSSMAVASTGKAAAAGKRDGSV